MGYTTFEYHGPTPYTQRDKDYFAGNDEIETDHERKASLEEELKELRTKMEDIQGEIENELSAIEDGFWHPELLDTDKLRDLFSAGAKLADDMQWCVNQLEKLS